MYVTVIVIGNVYVCILSVLQRVYSWSRYTNMPACRHVCVCVCVCVRGVCFLVLCAQACVCALTEIGDGGVLRHNEATRIKAAIQRVQRLVPPQSSTVSSLVAQEQKKRLTRLN